MPHRTRALLGVANRSPNKLRLQRSGRDPRNAPCVLGDRRDEPVPLVVAAQELALLLAVAHEQEQMPVAAVNVHHLKLDQAATALEANVEELATRVRTDVDARRAGPRADDVEPSSDLQRSAAREPRFPWLSLLAAVDDWGGPPGRSRASPSIPLSDGRSTQQASATCRAVGRVLCLVRPKPNDVFYATRLPFDPGSPTAGCARAQWSTSYMEELWSRNLVRCPWKSAC